MHKIPFFSVCLIATKRESTITEVLESLCLQTFNDFEVIVTIRKYNDKTLEKINIFQENDLYIQNKDKFKIVEIDEEYDSIAEWNDPLKYAIGKYVGILEGDDKFEPNHLFKAYQEIITNENIGIYATGNKQYTYKKLGFIESYEYHKYILSFIEVPPPSQTFFIRIDKKNNPYLYNTNDFVYAPEIELYLRISNDGYNIFHSDQNGVIRSTIPSENSGLGWKYFQDQIKIIKEHKNQYEGKELLRLDKMFKILMLKSFIRNILKKRKIDLKLFISILDLSNLFELISRRIKSKLIKPKIVFNFRKEPHISILGILKYFIFTYPRMFPSKHYNNFKRDVVVIKGDSFNIAIYKNIKIYYPSTWKSENIIANMDAILNEQSYDYNNISPHQYVNSDYFMADDIVYDIGAAEGLQSKLWVNRVKQIVIFEPEPITFKCLNMTFSDEISNGKVILVPEGISGSKFQTKIKNQEYNFDTLDSLVGRYSLPYPTYIKADIEGHEKSLIQNLDSLLQHNTLKMVQIMTYHRPEDEIEIPKMLKKFQGQGYFSEGLIWFNEDFDKKLQKLVGGSFDKIPFHTFRKCMYTWEFNVK